MKPIEEVYPGCLEDDYFCSPSSYYEMLESFGYEIVISVDDKDYEGDSRILFKDGDKYGHLIFGWGSCSGCDALQGCNSYAEVNSLRQSLYDSIDWRTASEMLEFFQSRDWETQYSWHADETKQYVDQVRTYLAGLEDCKPA